jgi:COP9 signalosome complex subunit 1
MYLQPFASIRLELMSVAFGWTVEEVEKAVVGLIQSGDIKARVDSLNKVLKAKDVDPRTELFLRATTAGEEMQSATRRLLLRLRLCVTHPLHPTDEYVMLTMSL